MAKRRRLTPARPDAFEGPMPQVGGALAPPFGGPSVPASQAAVAQPDHTPGRAPIAQVAGDVALTAAFEEVQGELKAAQREGRMVLALPLDAVRADYLIRDRISSDPEEMTVLQDSLRARGQQTPIEVTDLGHGRYGLISGWRRLQALQALYAETGGLKRFATVKALLRLPADRPAAYLAMIEENEIRADLSFYERARIVAQAVGEGVFDSDKQALQSLFSSVTFSKRSKIKSFLPLVAALDPVLRHPARIPERLGLALSKALETPGVAETLRAALRPGTEMTADEERALLEAALKPAAKPKGISKKTGSNSAIRDISSAIPTPPFDPKSDLAPPMPAPFLLAPGICISARRGRVELEGAGINAGLIERLKNWLRVEGQSR